MERDTPETSGSKDPMPPDSWSKIWLVSPGLSSPAIRRWKTLQHLVAPSETTCFWLRKKTQNSHVVESCCQRLPFCIFCPFCQMPGVLSPHPQLRSNHQAAMSSLLFQIIKLFDSPGVVHLAMKTPTPMVYQFTISSKTPSPIVSNRKKNPIHITKLVKSEISMRQCRPLQPKRIVFHHPINSTNRSFSSHKKSPGWH